MAFDRRDGCRIDRRLRDKHGQTAQAGSARTGRASDRMLGTDPDYCVVVRSVEVRAMQARLLVEQSKPEQAMM
jgi:hypothetical protein